MNIIVCAKLATNVSEIKIDPATKKPILQGVPKEISDIDKSAVEEAIKLRDKYKGKIIIVTVGPPESKEKIKSLLAMGADEAVLVPMPEKEDYYNIATLISAAIKKIGSYDIILCGEASVDQFSGQVAPRIAGILNIPQVTYAQKITPEEGKVVVDRNMGDKIFITESTFPVVISVTKEINKPRLPTLMQIMAATKKPIQEQNAAALGISDTAPKVETIEIKGVPMERKNIVLEGSAEDAAKKLAENLTKESVF